MTFSNGIILGVLIPCLLMAPAYISAETSDEAALRELEQKVEQLEAKKKAEEEMKKRAAEEAKRQAEEETKREAEQERIRAEQEEERKRAEAEARKKNEVLKKQEEEAAKQRAEEAEKLKNNPALEIGRSCTFALQYSDKGSGGHLDVSIYDPKLESGYRSIGSYAQGNYDNPNGCITVVKPLEPLPDGKPPLVYPAGYTLIWTDKKSGADMDGSVWHPQPPDNDYVCIGSVAQTGYTEPHIAGYACVHKCLVKAGAISSAPVWTDEGTGAASQVSIYQLPTSQVIFALPGRTAPGLVNDLNPTGMCQ